ncbi:MAG: hypothetical protein H5T63_11955, partial [Chloroflexi bacterium]|nr:hypothetical protein [Chloroflexota bacterium]
MSALSRLLARTEHRGAALRVALGYLAAITAAELLTTLLEPRAGLVLHGALLVVLLLHSAFVWEFAVRDLLLSLCFAPL